MSFIKIIVVTAERGAIAAKRWQSGILIRFPQLSS